jgi:uncharacterized membrane protein
MPLMRYKLNHEDQLFSTRRLEALSDGVFSIAMTLLVLDLDPRQLGNDLTSSQLLHAIGGGRDSIISFVISFLLLGSMWAVHMRQFEYIKKANRHLTMINTLRLLIVVIIPLSTSIAGRYSELVVGRILLPLNFFVLVLVSYWEWRYATHAKVKLAVDLPPGVQRTSDIRNKAMLILAFLVIIASAWIGDVAFLLLTLIPYMMRYLAKRTSA